jgi:hypothetical protein
MRHALFLAFCAVFLFSVEGYSEFSESEKEFYKTELLSKKRRTDLINYLISVNDYKSYLEIGVADGKNLNEIIAVRKVGVDPNPPLGNSNVFGLTSDEYFARSRDTFHIIFIDGLHLYEQVLRDVDNSLKCLNVGGTIVLHDCMPLIERHQIRPAPPAESWTGDVWKAVAYIRMNYEYCSLYVLNLETGCGILTVQQEKQELFPWTNLAHLNWEYYTKNKERVLNVKSFENWILEYKGL